MSDTAGSDQPPLFKLLDPDGNEVAIGGKTVAEQQAGIAAVQAKWADRLARAEFVDSQRDVDTVKEWAWEWVDDYTPFPVPGSQGGPSLWPQYTADVNTGNPVQDALTNLNRHAAVLAARIELLRVQQTRDEVRWIKVARAFEVLFAVVRRSYVADSTLTPPPDR